MPNSYNLSPYETRCPQARRVQAQCTIVAWQGVNFLEHRPGRHSFILIYDPNYVVSIAAEKNKLVLISKDPRSKMVLENRAKGEQQCVREG